MNRDLSTTKYERVFLNEELANDCRECYLNREVPPKIKVAAHIQSTAMPDGTVIKYIKN